MRYLTAALLLLLISGTASAEIKFPAFTDYVVDDATILSPQTKTTLIDLISTHEKKTGEQVIVATVASLQGIEIEPYANQLYRNWKLGQKNKNNGILLLIAPNERAMRIEAGYGLEGKMTDALSSRIISGIILPEFKNGNMEQGIIKGVTAIISVLEDRGITISTPVPQQQDNTTDTPPWLIIAGIIFIIFIRWRFGIWLIPLGMLGRGRGSGDDGFSGGGGGSSGGGGASGKW